MCPICWISGFIAALFGGSVLAVANHPISWIISIALIAYAISKFYEAKEEETKCPMKVKLRIKKQFLDFYKVSL